MKVYCIVVTYNGINWLERCLGSLRKSRYPVNVIIVDNSSTDGSVDYIKQHFPEILLIEASANLGFGQANNIGLKKTLECNADFVLLLNQDAWIKEDTINKLVEATQGNPEYGIVSPFHLDASEQQLEQLFAELFDRYNNSIITDLYFNRLKYIYETGYVHAACWFMSRSCIETVGGFDPIYFHYGEDDDYLQRAKYFNFKIGLVPHAQVIHDSTYNLWEKVQWNENRNMVIALQQLKNMPSHFRTNVLLFFKTGFDELTSLLLYRKFKKFRFRLTIFLKTIFKLGKIHKSYQASFRKKAFLS